jgi:hypothetical protein
MGMGWRGLFFSTQRQASPICEILKDLDRLLYVADPNKDLIDVEGIAVASVFSFQSSSVDR